jgi:hypothetical protein
MEKLPGLDRHEPIRIEVVLFQLQGPIAPIKVAGPVVGDPMTQDHILSARWRSNWVGLNEADFANRPA